MSALRPKPDDKALTREGLGLVRARDWAGLKGRLAAYPPETAYALLRLIGSAVPADVSLEGLVEGPQDAAGLTAAGAIEFGLARRHRGMGMAEDLSEDAVDAYVPALLTAQDLLARATEANPGSGLAAGWRIAACVDATEAEKDAAEAALIAARDVPVSGWSRLLSARSEKWGGSHAAMWRVAWDHAKADAPGTLGLVAKAHFEQWLYLSHFEQSPGAAAHAAAYFKEDRVRSELLDASSRALAADHPDPRNPLHAHNWFAFTFWMAEEFDLAKPHLERMGRNIDREIWVVARPRLSLALARLQAGLVPW